MWEKDWILSNVNKGHQPYCRVIENTTQDDNRQKDSKVMIISRTEPMYHCIILFNIPLARTVLTSIFPSESLTASPWEEVLDTKKSYCVCSCCSLQLASLSWLSALWPYGEGIREQERREDRHRLGEGICDTLAVTNLIKIERKMSICLYTVSG